MIRMPFPRIQVEKLIIALVNNRQALERKENG